MIMYKQKIRQILLKLVDRKIDIDGALKKLKFLPFEDLGFAKIDHHRALRRGFPEVVFCQNKTIEQVVEIIKKLASNNTNVLATRASPLMYKEVKKHVKNVEYNNVSKTILVRNKVKKLNKFNKLYKKGKILVLSAGTSDIPVAEESAFVAEVMGNNVERLYDVGVAGIQRLLSNKEKIAQSSVVIVVAGMDGALPSVVSGLIDNPLIAVPTSVGYGASFKGIAPLLTMLNCCSPGVVVVNIDNGFGAGYFASLINGHRKYLSTKVK